MLFALLFLPSIASALLGLAVRPYHRFVGWTSAMLSLATLGAALTLAAGVARGELPVTFGPGELIRVDALSALIACSVAAAACLVLFSSPGLAADDDYTPSQLRRYHALVNVLVLTMLAAVTVNNVGFMWVAVEATTVTSAMLVPLAVTKRSLEASWKYILIGSVGIALAFLGTVVAYFNFVALGGRAEGALNWSVLSESAPLLRPEVMRLAFAFLLVGYGTKAGLAPVHTWKPDTYAEAPVPLVALMSSGLFAVAVYAIVRWKLVVDATTGPGFTDSLLVVVGLVSLVIASFSLVIQRNYRRMLAYSSVEHAGLVCLGLALGPLGAFASFLHLVGHTAAKASTFLLAGEIERSYGSALIADVRGVVKRLPWVGCLFAAGVLSLLGVPPSGLFVSELALVRAGFASGRYWVTVALLLLLGVTFVSVIGHLMRLLFGKPAGEATAPRRVRFAPAGVAIAGLALLGLGVPASLAALLNQIAEMFSR